jgi:hypothetical protein
VTIKSKLTCPNCEGRRFIHCERAVERGGENAGGVAPAVGFVSKSWVRQFDLFGAFEQLICTGCGYTERYAFGLNGLQPDEKSGIRIIDATSKPGGPFR